MGEVKITILAEDLSNAELEAVSRNLMGVERSGKQAAFSFDLISRSTDRMAGLISHGLGVLTKLDLIELTLEHSTVRVRLAQENYNDAVANFGPLSDQAVKAARELEAAQGAAEKASLRAKLSYIGVTAQLVTMTIQAPRAAAGLMTLATSARTAAAGVGALNIALGASVFGAVAAATAFVGFNIFRDFKRQADLATAGIEDQRAELQRLENALEKLRKTPEFLVGLPGALEQVTVVERAIANQRIKIDKMQLEARGDQFTQFGHDMAAQAALTAEEMARVQEDAAQRSAQAWTQAMGAAGTSLQKFGIDFSQVGVGALENLEKFARLPAGLVPFSQQLGALAGQALNATKQERELVAAAIAAEPALLDQLSATARKGETMHELAASLGLTAEQEAELTRQGRLTEEGLLSQAEAARRLNSTMSSASGATAFGLTQSSDVTNWRLGSVRRSLDAVPNYDPRFGPNAEETRARGFAQQIQQFLFRHQEMAWNADLQAALQMENTQVSRQGFVNFGAIGKQVRQRAEAILAGDISITINLAPGEGSEEGVARGALRAIEEARVAARRI